MTEVTLSGPAAPRFPFAVDPMLPLETPPLIDMLPVAVYACDQQGQILWFNQKAIELWSRSPVAHEGAQLSVRRPKTSVDGRDIGRNLTPTAMVLRTGVGIHGVEGLVERPDGSRVWAIVHIDPVRDADGKVVGAIICFQDIADNNRMAQTLREQDQRLAATYEHAAIAISEIDGDGKLLRVNETVCSILGYSREELLRLTVFDVTHPEDRDSDHETYRRQVGGENSPYAVEKRLICKDGRIIWTSVVSSSIYDSAGRFRYSIRVMQDITERKQAELRQRALIDELNHRVKNTLATVQSLAVQTFRNARIRPEATAAFTARLFALSRTHDQLSQAGWDSADFKSIIDDVITLCRMHNRDRVRRNGPSVRLAPNNALLLAMVMHELAANAVKFGSLSSPQGRLDLHWSLVDPGSSRMLIIEWTESGGPLVRKPRRRGFGRRLIERAICNELNGCARVEFLPTGLKCRFEIPLPPLPHEAA